MAATTGKIRRIILPVILSGFLMMGQAWAKPVSVSSPDGRIIVTVSVKAKLVPNPPGERVYYSVQYDGQPLLLESPLGLEFRDQPPLAENLRIAKSETSTANTTWNRVWGKSKTVTNHYNQVDVTLKEARSPGRTFHVIFRAYNDGVALRYFLPAQDNLSGFRITAERTRFRFPGNPTVWAADYGGYASHQESEFEQMHLNALSPEEVYGVPLLVQVGESRWVAVAEANLIDWAGMYLTRVSGVQNTLVTALSPRPDKPGVLVDSRTPRYSPWRTLMIGQHPGDLIQSNLIQNLSEPLALNDTDWIHPGKSAWDRWWSGSYAPEVNFDVGMNAETMKYYIDLAAEMGWRYQLVDWWWYGEPFGDPQKVDITTPAPGVNIKELIRYADQRNVKLLLWLQWKHVDAQMEQAFPLYEKWGIAGVKIDFMARDDQQMVRWYRKVVQTAAKYHLLVDFHGAYKPTGMSRAYPNLLTREGVMGNEYNKWSDQVTPDHCLTIPFTRMLAGPMDFTPGGFRQKTRETFRAVGSDAPGPFVMGTRCFQLAMMVIYESPLQVLCDSPYNYRSSPAGTDFLKIVPVTWDETRVINGQVGDYITVARRSGKDWYLGCMTDWTGRTLNIPLDFLGAGRYEAEIWSDAYEADEYPDRLMKSGQTVTAGDTLRAVLQSGGGQVVRLTPQ